MQKRTNSRKHVLAKKINIVVPLDKNFLLLKLKAVKHIYILASASSSLLKAT